MQKTWFSKVWLTLKLTWLCIKYPFLYPRNRFTGLHYNWWWWNKKRSNLYKKYHYCGKIDLRPSNVYYYKWYNNFESFWTNWWALPLIKVFDWIHRNPMQWIHCLTSHTELDAIPEAWKNDFGLEWAKDVKQYLDEHHIRHYRIAQLKEKWGEFDWLYPPDFSDECLKLEHKYVERSKQICICCGKPATMVTPVQIWLSYYCDECAPEYAKPINEAGEQPAIFI